MILLLLLTPFAANGQQLGENVWDEDSSVQQDYVQMIKERTSHVDLETSHLKRSNGETEQEYRLKLQIWQRPRLFYHAEWIHWGFTQQEPVLGTKEQGNLNLLRLGIHKEAKGPAETELFVVNQDDRSGLEGSYSNYWQPWRWKITAALQSPWNDTLVSRNLGGYYQRAVLSGVWAWSQGQWSLSSVTKVSQYSLNDVSEFETTEQTQEIVLTRSWYGRTDFGFSYIWERGVVQNDQPPVEIPDRLNHAILTRIQHDFHYQLKVFVEGTYQFRQIQDNAASSVRGELSYDPAKNQHYWITYESGEGDEIQGKSYQIRWHGGLRINYL